MPDMNDWPRGAECLFEAREVSRALDAQAERIAERTRSCSVLSVIVLMNGGMYPAVALSRRLKRPLRIDYVHASRYREAIRGGEIVWQRGPAGLPLGDEVLLVDDIFDEGHTMAAVARQFRELGVQKLHTAALARKRHQRGLERDWIDDFALEVPDRYVFGCGMDYRGLWRQLDSIWALPE